MKRWIVRCDNMELAVRVKEKILREASGEL